MIGLLPSIDEAVGVNTVAAVTWFGLPKLIARFETSAMGPLPPTTYLKLRIPDFNGTHTSLTFQGGSITWDGRRVYVGWMPDPAAGSALFTPPLAWHADASHCVHIAGVFDNGHLYSSRIVRQPDGSLTNRTLSFAAPGGFRAVAIWHSGKMIGISAANRVYWLRMSDHRVEEWSPTTDLATPARAVGCFLSHQTAELLVIFDDGTLTRVPVPA